MKAALLFIADENYMGKAWTTIRGARRQGAWKEDIVVLTTSSVWNRSENKKRAVKYDCQMMPLPEKRPRDLVCCDSLYMQSRKNIFDKFYMMDTRLKHWDTILYIDSGAVVFGDLNRLVRVCTDRDRIYAHSDSYPAFEWKLSRQFVRDKATPQQWKELEHSYHLDHDYFQSTVMIFGTNLITETTVQDLQDLARRFPFSFRSDQSIFNLYFQQRWTPLPVRDDISFLYDFAERDGRSPHEYVLLKYPHEK